MNIRIYLTLGAIASASLFAASAMPASDFIKGMIVTPGVGALLGALFQLARDSASHHRQSHLQLDQQIFTLGAGSHMASVAFDKHVAFCEAYMSEVHETISVLFREGPTPQALACAQKLHLLKRQYAAWMPRSMALKLEPFEEALQKLGAQAHLINALSNQDQDTRSKAIDASYAIFCNLLDLKKIKETDPDHRKEIAAENVKDEIRSILGINELFDIRAFIIERSASFARENTSYKSDHTER